MDLYGEKINTGAAEEKVQFCNWLLALSYLKKLCRGH
jgi:hypothetical protein